MTARGGGRGDGWVVWRVGDGGCVMMYYSSRILQELRFPRFPPGRCSKNCRNTPLSCLCHPVIESSSQSVCNRAINRIITLKIERPLRVTGILTGIHPAKSTGSITDIYIGTSFLKRIGIPESTSTKNVSVFPNLQYQQVLG